MKVLLSWLRDFAPIDGDPVALGEQMQVACGAFNMTAGDLVPLATVGTTMPNGMEIGRRKMRGEWSNGMLCSARELGLGGDHAGIHILPAGLPVGVPFSLPEPVVEEVPAAALADVSVAIDDPDLCGRFVARVLRGVTVGDSDPAIARRLTLLGMRPINSLVDVSNYVMLELGQPNHPYDLAKVRGGGLRVRR